MTDGNEVIVNTTYRINMAFQAQVHEYIKMMARATGKNMTEVTNAIIMQHMRKHPEGYLKAKQFVKEINGERGWYMANDTDVIRKTTNYEQFKYLGGNRGVSEMRVKRLMKSISSIGYIQACPIIVNENNQVVDGQARLEACKRLGVPV